MAYALRLHYGAGCLWTADWAGTNATLCLSPCERVVDAKPLLFVVMTVSTIVGVDVDEFDCVCFRSLLREVAHCRLLSLSYAQTISLSISPFSYSVLSVVCCTIHTRSMFVCHYQTTSHHHYITRSHHINRYVASPDHITSPSYHQTWCGLVIHITRRYVVSWCVMVYPVCVGPGHHCYRIGAIRFLAICRKRHSWNRVSLVSLIILQRILGFGQGQI